MRPQLTVLSYGGGQDSSALLEKYHEDPVFREKYAPNDFLVVMSDTGDEYDETNAHVKRVQKQCQERGIEFVLITSDMGFHSESWQSLRHFYRTKEAIGSKAYPKTCTDRLKIEPIYRFLERWISEKYGVRCNRKKGLYDFAERYGRINMLIGIAKGEERRASDSTMNPNKWFRTTIQTVYPLLEMGWDRQACQDYLHSKGLRVVPSNCKACPFLSLEELEYLRRFDPTSLEDWVQLELAKLTKYKHKEAVIQTDKQGAALLDRHGTPKVKNQNYGVFGVIPLPQKIEEAKAKFLSWSDERVREYRYSHGHCVSTAY